ncbi:tetratricopeptide repeat protein [Candidatus Poribacteria bacterium]|nr:tetratricopeptide repeat protein [Candidatus Poribacteria bacterium]
MNRSADSSRVTALDVTFIFCLCLIVYANSFGVGWISDDVRFIKSNPGIRSLSNTGEFFTNPADTAASTGREGIYRPLRTLSFAIDYAIWGANPFGFHVTSFVLHFVSSVLVFLLCMSLDAGRRSALVASALFAAHPAQVEAITWISSRADCMATVFLLISFLLFVRARKEKGSVPVLLGGSWLCFLLALLSKETAIVLPALLITYDIFAGKMRVKALRSRLVEYCLFIGLAVTYFAARARLLQMVSQGGYWGGSLVATMLTMAKCFLIYLRIVFLPRASSCLEYMVPLAGFPLTFAIVWPLILVAIFVTATIAVWRLSPRAGFGLSWYLIALAPVSNVLPMSMLMAERFLYFPMVGICIAALPIMETATRKRSRRVHLMANASFCALLFLLGVTSVVKNSAWRDPVVLWNQSLHDYPDSYRARMGLAGEYYDRGENLEAIKQYGIALRLFPNVQVMHDIGNAYRQVGDIASAIAAYRAALAMDPNSSWTLTSLGIAYMKQGKMDQAIEVLQRATEIDKSYAAAHFFLGNALAEEGDLETALKEYRTALVYAPDAEEVRRRIADIERRQK